MTDAANDAGVGLAVAPMLPPSPPRLMRTLRALQGELAGRSAGRGPTGGTAAEPGQTASIDLDDVLIRFRGRRELVQKTLSVFREECGRLLDEVRRCIDVADLAGAMTAAHRLKGAAGTAAAGAVREAAGRVEEGCRRGRADEVIASFADLERDALKVIRELGREVAATPSAGPIEIG